MSHLPLLIALWASLPGGLAWAGSAATTQGGQQEIESIQALGDPVGDGPLVLVLIEARLWQPLAGAPALGPALHRWQSDLAAEGWQSQAMTVDWADRPGHRDGRRLLALRQFLQGVAAEHELAGVILIGRFPDAFLVRSCNWRKSEALVLGRGTDHEKDWGKVSFVRRIPEPVAHRADIVLADLDGNWEARYIQPRLALASHWAVFPQGIGAEGGEAAAVEQGQVYFEDFFFIDDGLYEEAKTAAGHPWVILDDRHANAECSDLDRQRKNPLALPEIAVSRLDAHGIAWSPNPAIRDREGRALLDAEGHVQALEFDPGQPLPSWDRALWVADPVLERELLLAYFERNHRYRTTAPGAAYRPASIACDLGSGYGVLKAASPDWHDLQENAADRHGRPDLMAFLDWLELPAVLRTVRAHSDPWGSVFASPDVTALDARFHQSRSGGPLCWTPDGTRLVPSLARAAGRGKLDFFLLRSLWPTEASTLQAAIYLHTGCHGISPPGAAALPFDHPDYGRRGGGEALLFYGGGVGMIGRAKVFYDEPRGFAAVLAEGGTLGDTWRHYFEVESQSSWAQAGGDIGRKRSYFWSLLGDWTLRLPRPRP